MKIDRGIGIIGLIISIIGVTTIEKMNLSWGILGIGIILILYFIYIELRPSIVNKYFSYIYDFSENKKGLVKGKKITVFKINKPNITQLIASGLTSTGDYKNFKTNIGRITVQTDDGGAKKIICDLDKPLRKGKEISWVLTYGLINSFNEGEEEVGVPCLTQGKMGSIHLIFSKQRIPISIKGVSSKNGVDKKNTGFEFNKDSPEIFWQFKIKFGLIHVIRWRW
ncbi:hypothetical protein [Labilibaculum euxinus]